MLQQIIPGIRIALVITILTGLFYPGIVTGLCQLLFHRQANGSLVNVHGRIIGSSLVGQRFARPEYFHPRPSAAGDGGYDASSSGGSNLGPTSKKLHDRIKKDAEMFRKENPDFHGLIPADVVTASGSGLDPHISPASAKAQAFRIARARGAPVEQVHEIIDQYTEIPAWGFLGEARINVLWLNLALDQCFEPHHASPGGL